MLYYIKIGNKYYGGEGDGYYKDSNQSFGGYRAWSGELGIKANAPSGISRYEIVDTIEKAQKVSTRSIAEIISNILERQQYGYIEKGEILINGIADNKE